MDINKFKSLPRYKGFTFLSEPVPFDEYFKDKNYPLVQLHDINPIPGHNDVIGFAGTFSWKDNILTSEDGDSYEPDMPIWGFHEFEYEGQICLDILTDKW